MILTSKSFFSLKQVETAQQLPLRIVYVLYIPAIRSPASRENVLDCCQGQAKNTQTLEGWPRTLSTAAILCSCGVTCTIHFTLLRLTQASERNPDRHKQHVCHVTLPSSPQIAQILQLEDLQIGLWFVELCWHVVVCLISVLPCGSFFTSSVSWYVRVLYINY